MSIENNNTPSLDALGKKVGVARLLDGFEIRTGNFGFRVYVESRQQPYNRMVLVDSSNSVIATVDDYDGVTLLNGASEDVVAGALTEYLGTVKNPGRGTQPTPVEQLTKSAGVAMQAITVPIEQLAYKVRVHISQTGTSSDGFQFAFERNERRIGAGETEPYDTLYIEQDGRPICTIDDEHNLTVADGIDEATVRRAVVAACELYSSYNR